MSQSTAPPQGEPARSHAPWQDFGALRAKLPVKPFWVQLQEAFAFQRAHGRSLAPALGIVWGAWLLITILIVASLLGLLWLIGARPTAGFALEVNQWPALLPYVMFLSAGLFGVATATALLGTFRIVHRARKMPKGRRNVLANELGRALEAVGIIDTIGWVVAMMALIALCLATAWGGAQLIRPDVAPFSVEQLLFTVAFAVPLLWIFVVLPHAYVLPVLVVRDAGWTRGFEVGIGLMMIEGAHGAGKALFGSVLFVSGVGMPAGAALMLGALDDQLLLISALMREKMQLQIIEELRASPNVVVEILNKSEVALDAGRLVEALNGFQMRLHKKPEDVRARRGEAICYLKLGNGRARESLERWKSLAPDDAEPVRLLKELDEGTWNKP